MKKKHKIMHCGFDNNMESRTVYLRRLIFIFVILVVLLCGCIRGYNV